MHGNQASYVEMHDLKAGGLSREVPPESSASTFDFSRNRSPVTTATSQHHSPGMVTTTFAMASSSRNPPVPSADSLAFSAQLYTSQISSWIPADFGNNYQAPTTTESFLLNSDRDDRLGIGHALLEVPKHRRHENTQLEKLMGLNKGKGKGRVGEEEVLARNGVMGEDEDEEEESRGRIGKKRKIGTIDLLAGKKKAKAKAKMKDQDKDKAVSKLINTTDATSQSENPKSSPANALDANIDETATESAIPTAEIILEKNGTTNNSQISESTSTPTDLLTKNQRKKMRKKQKKLELGQNGA
jgi:hypothetical protein